VLEIDCFQTSVILEATSIKLDLEL